MIEEAMQKAGEKPAVGGINHQSSPSKKPSAAAATEETETTPAKSRVVDKKK